MSSYKSYAGTPDGLRQYFPKFKMVDTLNELTNPKGKGVYVLRDGKILKVRIFGGCPNFINGKCSLTNCISDEMS